jgi:hypothetical protein
VDTRIARRTVTNPAVDTVVAITVQARVGEALVDVRVTGRAGVSRGAIALIGLHAIEARSSIFARPRIALVDVSLAEITRVATRTTARKSVQRI